MNLCQISLQDFVFECDSMPLLALHYQSSSAILPQGFKLVSFEHGEEGLEYQRLVEELVLRHLVKYRIFCR